MEVKNRITHVELTFQLWFMLSNEGRTAIFFRISHTYDHIDRETTTQKKPWRIEAPNSPQANQLRAKQQSRKYKMKLTKITHWNE